MFEPCQENPQLNAFVRGVTAAATGAIAGAEELNSERVLCPPTKFAPRILPRVQRVLTRARLRVGQPAYFRVTSRASELLRVGAISLRFFAASIIAWRLP